MKLTKIKNQYVVSPVKLSLADEMLLDTGDWIITGVEGEQYPCKPDIFEKTYTILKEKREQ